MNNELQPKISIIMPVFNSEKSLKKAIESIVSQIYKNWELIIVDDGSTDNGGRLCDMYSSCDPRIFVFHIPNSGVSHARNYGIKKATGELLCFVDSDDTIVSHALSTIVRNIGEFDLLIYGTRTIPLGIEKHLPSNVDYTSIDNLAEDFKQIACAYLLNNSSNKCFRRNIILSCGICFPEDLSLGEDVIFNMEYIQRCNNVRVLSDVLYEYNESVRGSLSKKIHPETIAIQRRLKESMDSTFKYKPNVVEITGTIFVDSIVIDMIRVGSNSMLKRERKVQLITSWLNDPYFNEQFALYESNLRRSKFILSLIRNKQVTSMIAVFRVRSVLARFYHYCQRIKRTITENTAVLNHNIKRKGNI